MSPSTFDRVATFNADGVLFDMVCVPDLSASPKLIIRSKDGTLTDSIAAVEAAWTKKAVELGLEPRVVIEATHGRRASDNLMDLVPGLRKEHVDGEVDRRFDTNSISKLAHLLYRF